MRRELEDQLKILKAEKQIREYVNKSNQSQFYYDTVSSLTDEELECEARKKFQELKDEKEKVFKESIDGAFNYGWSDRFLIKIIDASDNSFDFNHVIYENQKEFFDKFKNAEDLSDFDFIGGDMGYSDSDWNALKPFIEGVSWAFTPKQNTYKGYWEKPAYILFYVERFDSYNIKARLFYPAIHLGKLADRDLEIVEGNN